MGISLTIISFFLSIMLLEVLLMLPLHGMFFSKRCLAARSFAVSVGKSIFMNVCSFSLLIDVPMILMLVGKKSSKNFLFSHLVSP